MSRKISVVILLAIITLIVIYVAWRREEFELIKHLEKRFLFHQSILTVLVICVNGYITKIFLALFDIEIKPKEWFGLAVLTAMGNYVTPFRGGMALKGIYLKRRLEFPYSTFASTMAASYILSFLCAGILGTATLILILKLYGTIQWTLLVFFCAASATMMGIIMLSPTIENSQNRFTLILKNTFDGWNRIKGNTALVIKVSSLIVLNYVIISARLYYGYRMLQVDLGILPVFLVSFIMGFSILIAVTPGSLGIQEAAIGFTSKLVGAEFSSGIMVSGILRAVDIVVVLALGPIFMHLLIKKRGVNSAIGKRGTDQV